jgi:hypothetical protein
VKGRLNLFQASMLRWRGLHPYTAVHVVRIERPLDVPRLTAIIEGQLRALGLTGLVLDLRRQRFEYTGGPAAVVLAVHADGGAPMRVVQHTIECELNLPFEREGRINPFRFFCVDSGPWFQLGLAYDHFVAGGDSIVVLLEGIVSRYTGEKPEAPPSPPIDRYPATFGRLFFRHAWRALRGLPALREMAASCRRSVRPDYPRGEAAGNGFIYRRLEPAEAAALTRSARAWGIALSDLLLAILLKTLEPFAGERIPTRARHELAVASILNLRRDLGVDPNTTFGQFLSSFRISHPLPRGLALEQLARDIGAETARIKREKLYLQSLLGVAVSGVVWRALNPDQRQRLYAKSYPVWGALTTLNVNALWAGAGGRMPPPDYLRGVSTGPLAPIVVAVTAAGDLLHLGLSYRTTAFTAANVDKMADGIAACARSLDR